MQGMRCGVIIWLGITDAGTPVRRIYPHHSTPAYYLYRHVYFVDRVLCEGVGAQKEGTVKKTVES
jgi:hypothetical protein